MNWEELELPLNFDRTINETVEREAQTIEDYLFGDSHLEEREIPKVEAPIPKRRGRPPGVKESAPRRPKTNVKAILEHLRVALDRLERL